MNTGAVEKARFHKGIEAEYSRVYNPVAVCFSER